MTVCDTVQIVAPVVYRLHKVLFIVLMVIIDMTRMLSVPNTPGQSCGAMKVCRFLGVPLTQDFHTSKDGIIPGWLVVYLA